MRFPSWTIFYKQIIPLLLFAVAFVAATLFAEQYHDVIGTIVKQGGVFGILCYIVLTAVCVVFVIPLDIVFLIPIGVTVWGPMATASMSISGWTIGAAVAFGTARKFGLPVVNRLIGLTRIHAIEQRVPRSNFFWTVVFLRMLVSVDILSYALGLFSTMSWRTYLVATIIGVTPFGFYFAYTGVLPLGYRIFAVGLALVVAILMVMKYGFSRQP